MFAGRTVFAQLIDHVPPHEFHKCIARYRGNYKLRGFSCLDQFLCLAFAQLTFRESLRDIEACLRSVEGKLYHMGSGGAVYRVGGDVSAPVLLLRTWPVYSEEAYRAKLEGTVVLYVQIDPSGHATHIAVAKSLGLGLDEKATQAVSNWRFAPGMKDGKPVTVEATVEFNFRLPQREEHP